MTPIVIQLILLCTVGLKHLIVGSCTQIHRDFELEVDQVEIFLKILLVIASIGLIAIVLLQKGKSAGLSGAISGGAEHLFGKQKARGLELLLSRVTVGFAVSFFLLSLIVAYVVKA